jgi:hypothetical protein
MSSTHSYLLVGAGAVAVFAPAAHAQLAVQWFTVDGGGGRSNGGAYALQGTFGQHDAQASSANGRYVLRSGYWVPFITAPGCGSADFNCDGDVGTDADIEAFFACLAGNCPGAPCTSSADFNGDGDVATDADIEAFFGVLAGGSC